MSLSLDYETSIPSRDTIINRAKSLINDLGSRSDEADSMRRLPDSSMQDLFSSGMLRILQPKRFGGYEMDWAMHSDAARIIAKGCPSSAWIVSVVGAHSAIVGRLSEVCQEEVWGKNQDQLIATASARVKGEATKVSGGYVVSGVWRFASGIDHAEWSMISTHLGGNDPHDHTKYIRLLIPVNEIEIVDTWHVVGMKATGSKDIKCEKVFVPDHRVINAHESFGKNPPGSKVNPEGYLYQVNFLPYFGSSFLGPLIGAAEGAYEAYKSITSVKKGAIFGNSVAEQVPVQIRLSESSAELSAAVLLYENISKILHSRGSKREELTPEEYVLINRDRAFIAHLCVNATSRLVKQMGATGLFKDNPVHSFARDVSAMATQLAANWDRNMSLFGKYELGIKTGDRMVDSVSSTKK